MQEFGNGRPHPIWPKPELSLFSYPGSNFITIFKTLGMAAMFNNSWRGQKMKCAKGRAWLRAMLAAILLSNSLHASAATTRAAVLVSPDSVKSEDLPKLAAYAKSTGADLFELSSRVVESASALKRDIDKGLIDEEGADSPPSLPAFSRNLLAEVPNLFGYNKIHVISSSFLPIEMAAKNHEFVGDRIEVSHEFAFAPGQFGAPPLPARPLTSYVIEAVIAMDSSQRRIDQDIIQVALENEKRFPVVIEFDSGKRGIKRIFDRDDVAILHIDTHGSGPAIQVSRAGAMITAAEIPNGIKIPVVLLFGCEGIADQNSFGSVLHANGAETVISSFAKFQSFGITGDPNEEWKSYEAFFAAIKRGETVGSALIHFRDVAQRTAEAIGKQKTLTRHFFALLGSGRVRFTIP